MAFKELYANAENHSVCTERFLWHAQADWKPSGA